MDSPASPQPSDPTPPPPSADSPPPAGPSKPNWPLYVAGGLVLLPGVFGATGSSDAAAIGALLFAPAGALVAGILLGVRVGQSTGARVLLSMGFAVGCLIAAECVAAIGCAVGNPRFNFH